MDPAILEEIRQNFVKGHSDENDEPLPIMWKNNVAHLDKLRGENSTVISQILMRIPQLIRYPHHLQWLIKKGSFVEDSEMKKIIAIIPRPLSPENIDGMVNKILKLVITKIPAVTQLIRDLYRIQLEDYLRRSLTGIPFPRKEGYFADFEATIADRFEKAIVSVGYMAGSFSGDATVSQTIQNSLNAFHTPGAMKKVSGDAFLSMISNKEPAEHVTEAFFREHLTEEQAIELTRTMISVKLKDIILVSRVINKEKDRLSHTPLFAENQIVIDRINDWYGQIHLIDQADSGNLAWFQNAPYFIYLRLDNIKMSEHRLTMKDVVAAIENQTTKESLRVIYSPFYLAEVYVVPVDLGMRGITNPKILLNKQIHYRDFSFLHATLSNIKDVMVKGLPDIDRINVKTYSILNSIREEGYDSKHGGFYALVNIEELRSRGVTIEMLAERLQSFYNRKIKIVVPEISDTLKGSKYFDFGFTLRHDRLVFPTEDYCDILDQRVDVKQQYPTVYLRKCQSVIQQMFKRIREEEKDPEKIRESVERKRRLDGWNISLNVVYAEVAGKGISTLMCHPAIDPSTTLEDSDTKLMSGIIGIEGVRNMLVYRMKETLGTLKVNPRHLTLLADFMTYRGSLVSISYKGASKMGIDPAGLATFEQVGNSFGSAAFTGASETTATDPTLGVLVGVRPVIGKRFAKVLASEDFHAIEEEITPIVNEPIRITPMINRLAETVTASADISDDAENECEIQEMERFEMNQIDEDVDTDEETSRIPPVIHEDLQEESSFPHTLDA